MPIYEYQCDACQHKFEIIQKVSDPLLTQCPECRKKKLRKLVSAAAFQLKGTGWYVTDFRDKKPARGKETASGGDGDKPAGDAGKKDSTTESASTPKKAAAD